MIEGGHGPLQNILDHYTVDHVNNFIREIDRKSRLARIDRIYENRVAQLDNKGYEKEMRKLYAAHRQAEVRQSGSGQTANRLTGPMTPEEQAALDAQGHYSFRDMPVEEQEELTAQIGDMWAQIPEHLKEKARNMG